MRELYDLLPEKPEGITKEIIDDYETRMAPWEHDEAEETQILDEALDAHHGQIDTVSCLAISRFSFLLNSSVLIG